MHGYIVTVSSYPYNLRGPGSKGPVISTESRPVVYEEIAWRTVRRRDGYFHKMGNTTDGYTTFIYVNRHIKRKLCHIRVILTEKIG